MIIPLHPNTKAASNTTTVSDNTYTWSRPPSNKMYINSLLLSDNKEQIPKIIITEVETAAREPTVKQPGLLLPPKDRHKSPSRRKRSRSVPGSFHRRSSQEFRRSASATPPASPRPSPKVLPKVYPRGRSPIQKPGSAPSSPRPAFRQLPRRVVAFQSEIEPCQIKTEAQPPAWTLDIIKKEVESELPKVLGFDEACVNGQHYEVLVEDMRTLHGAWFAMGEVVGPPLAIMPTRDREVTIRRFLDEHLGRWRH